MTALTALYAARNVGVRVALDDHDLAWEADHQPPDDLLDLLRRNKEGIVSLLSESDPSWTREDWQAYFSQRAAIAEFDGCLERQEAAAMALEACILLWLKLHPIKANPGACQWCGGSGTADNHLIAFNCAVAGSAWLHGQCHTAWSGHRMDQAIGALSGMEINIPATEHGDCAYAP